MYGLYLWMALLAPCAPLDMREQIIACNEGGCEIGYAMIEQREKERAAECAAVRRLMER